MPGYKLFLSLGDARRLAPLECSNGAALRPAGRRPGTPAAGALGTGPRPGYQGKS